MTKLLAFICILVISHFVAAQHLADPEFNATVAKPAYQKSGPRVMFDEAHFNYHTMTDRFKPFVDFLTNYGYPADRNC